MPAKKKSSRGKKTTDAKKTSGRTPMKKSAGAASRTSAAPKPAKKRASRKTTTASDGSAGAKKRPAGKTASRKRASGKTASGARGRGAPHTYMHTALGVHLPCRAYRGQLPYVFVSYAHRDMKQVFRIIKKLSDKRYRIWFDEGIEPGNEWPETVGRAVVKCSQFLVFMSPWAARSRNVRNEINLAFTEHRDILVVFLDPTELTEGMRLQIGTVQFINRYDMSEKECLKQLVTVLRSSVKG